MAEKYTPNKPKDAGLEARQKLGWWHAYRFLILRRISQLSIILMFLSGPIWQIWILKGNYSSSMLLDTVPLTDPLITAESLMTLCWQKLLSATSIPTRNYNDYWRLDYCNILRSRGEQILL